MILSLSSRKLARGLLWTLGVMLIVGMALLPAHVTYSADPYAVVRTFTNPGGSGADSFGAAVAWVGQTALIGAPGYDPGAANDAGAAYVYDEVQNLSAPPVVLSRSVPITAEQFGFVVADFGGQALVGAPFADDAGIAAGAAYVFNVNTGQQILAVPNPSPDPDTLVQERFGFALAVVNGQVMVGAPGVKGAGVFNSAGEAYRMNGTTGAYSGTVSNPGPAFFESFGSAVAAYGADVLIAAPLDVVGGGGTDYGAVYLFDSDTLSLIRTFNNPAPTSNDRFGAAVAAFGNRVLIGAPNEDAAAGDAGAAYLFNGDTGQLLQTFSLTATTHAPASGDHFGTAVSLNGAHILIGAPERDGGAVDAGAAYLFNATTFSFIQVFSNPSPAVGEAFGSAVAVNTDLFLVGAPKVASTVGQAYLFSFAPPTPTPVAELFLPVVRRAIVPTP